ncbi:hemolysin family protein [Methylocella sp.]|uniref:hemolysin family protein n=1 Tax=Methylocella sp. TaxID=1978226 RepID=UPI0035AE2834
MSERDSAASEAETDRPRSQRPGLFDRLRAVFGGAPENDELQEAFAEADDMPPRERAMLKNVLGLRETFVEDVMVPRADIVAVPVGTSVVEALAIFRSAGHSRLPAHGDTLDDPRGMIHIRDLLGYGHSKPAAAPAARRRAGAPAPGFPDLSLSIADARLVRPVLFVPPSMQAIELLVKMQATRTHMALVIDEYGGVDGLASIEDIVEVIVGDIEDEHDSDESPKIDPAPGGGVFVDARAPIEDVARALGVAPETLDGTEEVDTIGGLIAMRAGHVPAAGEIIVEPPFEFEVLEADPRRARRLRVALMRHEGAGGA